MKEDTTPVIVGRNIRAIRRALHLTQTDLAKIMGGSDAKASNVGVSNMENGKMRITTEQVAKYAKALGVFPSRLMDDSPCATCHRQPQRFMTCRVCGTEG